MENTEYKFPVKNGIMVFDTEYANTYLLQLSYIIAYPDGTEAAPANFYFDHPTEFDDEKDRNSFGVAVTKNDLTPERLKELGTSPKHEALKKFFCDMATVDMVIAHNKGADIGKVNREMGRIERKGVEIEEWKWKPCFCTQHDHDFRSEYGNKLEGLAKGLDINYADYYKGVKGKDSVLDCKITLECFKRLCARNFVFSSNGELLRRIETPTKTTSVDESKKKTTSKSTTAKIEGELIISDEKIDTYDFTGKTFVVSGVSYKDNWNKRFEELIAKRLETKKGKGQGADAIKRADFVVVGGNFTPTGAKSKYQAAIERQREEQCSLIVFSEGKMMEFLNNLPS